MWRIVLAVVLLAACARGPLPARPGTGPTVQLPLDRSVPPVVPLVPRRFTEGEVLYIRNCADCHGWTARGDGPLAQILKVKPRDLRRREFSTLNTEADLIARILHGRELPVSLEPAALSLSEIEETSLLAHLQRLPSLPWQQINAGEKVYDSLCAACHGIYGRGDGLAAAALAAPPQDLNTPPYQSQVSDEELLRIVSEGKGTMPGAVDVLSPAELRAVITFIRLFSPGYEHYDRFCATCHGPDGHPPSLARDPLEGTSIRDQIPVLDAAYFRTHAPELVRTRMQHRRKEKRTGMPHFAGDLSSDQIAQIVTYLRTLPPEP